MRVLKILKISQYISNTALRKHAYRKQFKHHSENVRTCIINTPILKSDVASYSIQWCHFFWTTCLILIVPANTERYSADNVLREKKILFPRNVIQQSCSLQTFINIYPSVGLHERLSLKKSIFLYKLLPGLSCSNTKFLKLKVWRWC